MKKGRTTFCEQKVAKKLYLFSAFAVPPSLRAGVSRRGNPETFARSVKIGDGSSRAPQPSNVWLWIATPASPARNDGARATAAN
jgi:hypothetical protein